MNIDLSPCVSILFSLSLSLPPSPLSSQDDEVRDRLQKAMCGEIAVGSYSPLTKRNKMSTSPVPVRQSRGDIIQTGEVVGRHGQRGVVQRRKVEGEKPISNDTEKLVNSPSGERGVRKERHKGLYKESSVDREEDKNAGGTGRKVEPASREEVDGILDEMGGVPIRRRESSRLRELLKAIESYDRCVHVCTVRVGMCIHYP
jgi:hypothetical protein